jgi:predicted house-cleaning noncanonical NTP pyrophosphatase (MazG superfamily)
MKIYNKLVRDNIEEIMISKGAKPVTRILSDEEYLTELNKKLLEEINEYLESGEVEELADIKEVFLAILEAKQISNENLEEIRLNKVKKRGAFKKRLFLEKEL